MKIMCSPVTQAIVARFAKERGISKEDACLFLARLGSSTPRAKIKDLTSKNSLFFNRRGSSTQKGYK